LSKTHRRTGCIVCGKELVYQIVHKNLECLICHRTRPSNATCLSGHFVCDRCHSLSANDLVEEACINSVSRDPLELARMIMNSDKVPMHGPEHHFIVPAVLLAAYYNIKGDPEEKRRKIKEARARSSNILGGFCGFYGDCGAAVGTGIFVSLVTGATPLSKGEWRLSNTMTAKSLLSVANHGGPRCCKRNTFLSILQAVDFSKEKLHVGMNIDKSRKCDYSGLNAECLRSECPLYQETRI
jgi:hypothetical protein